MIFSVHKPAYIIVVFIFFQKGEKNPRPLHQWIHTAIIVGLFMAINNPCLSNGQIIVSTLSRTCAAIAALMLHEWHG